MLILMVAMLMLAAPADHVVADALGVHAVELCDESLVCADLDVTTAETPRDTTIATARVADREPQVPALAGIFRPPRG